MRRSASLAALLLSVLVTDAALGSHLAIGQAAPDLLLVCVVAVAARRGARAGAAFGFAAGLGADLFLATPLGTSALVFTLLGHVLGRSSRPPSTSGTAAALCTPASTCFACRTGRIHRAARRVGVGARHESPIDGPAGVRPTRLARRAAARRAAARRAALRRAVLLSVLSVGAGRLGVAVVATTLAGVPFPDGRGLLRIGAVAAVSAPFGPAAFAAVGRLSRPSGDRR